MTLQGCPGGTGFYKSVNARKTFVCALNGHEKRLPKTAPGSKGAAPGATNVWRLSSQSCVEPFFRRLWWLLCLDMFGPTLRAAPGEPLVRGGYQSHRRVVAPGI